MPWGHGQSMHVQQWKAWCGEQVHEEVLRLLQAAESQPALDTVQLGSLLERMLRASRTSRRRASGIQALEVRV